MRVIVYAQDLSGRRDDGYYTKPEISAALDLFYTNPDETNFSDADGEAGLTRSDAEAIFATDGRVAFFNGAGEKIVITLDPSN